MATSYKIRLKRFNGTDYDTLNLVSENIIMNSGNDLQTDLDNIDNKFNEFKSFTVTLVSTSWSNNAQTASNALFLASGHSYIVSPASASFAAYGEAQIYADDVTTDGQMVFHCTSVPAADLTVNIARVVAS